MTKPYGFTKPSEETLVLSQMYIYDLVNFYDEASLRKLFIANYFRKKSLSWLFGKRIQNPVKHLRWRDLQKSTQLHPNFSTTLLFLFRRASLPIPLVKLR